MALHTIIKLKKLAFAQQVVTGAFINGALIGAGITALAAAAVMNGNRSGMMCGRRSDHAGETDTMPHE